MPSRDAAPKDIAVTLMIVLLFVGGLVVGKFYDKYTGGAMILSIIMLAFVGQLRMPRQQKQQLFQALERYEKTPFGKFMAMANWLLAGVIAITILWAAVQWLAQ